MNRYYRRTITVCPRLISSRRTLINQSDTTDTEQYVGPALIQTPKSIYQPRIIVNPINFVANRKQKKLLETFEMNTNFDHDVFWEVINTSIQNIYDCIVNQEFTTILNQVERANHIPFAYWLSSLLSSTRIYDKVLDAQPTRVKSTVSQFDKFQFDYTASEDYESAKQLFDREIRLKDPSRAFIFSDISVEGIVKNELGYDLTKPLWKISVYYLNVERLGGVPEVLSENDLAVWCTEAERMVTSNASKVTVVYDALEWPTEFDPQNLRLYSIHLSNPDVRSKPHVIPSFSSVTVKPVIPENIVLE